MVSACCVRHNKFGFLNVLYLLRQLVPCDPPSKHGFLCLFWHNVALSYVQGGPEWRMHCQTAFILTTTPPILTIPGTSHFFG